MAVKILGIPKATRANAVTSQLPIQRWQDHLADGHTAAADTILDQVVSDAHRIDLVGESLRAKRQLEEQLLE